LTVRSTIRKTSTTLRLGMLLPLGATIRAYGGTDKWLHGYATHYARHLHGLRHKHNRILEIGVGGYENRWPGGSLRVWRDYFPRSTIVGLDLYPKDIELGGRVRFVQGDQAVAPDLARTVEALGGPPNIVIDDGSHLAEHAEASFRYLFPLMPSRSLYIIEDLHTSYWDDYGGGIPAPDRTAVGFTRRLVDEVQTRDEVFERKRDRDRPVQELDSVGSLHVYPGIAFITKV
jgi:hypothetical protein